MMNKIFGLFQDWKNQISWARVCAAVALAMAVIQEFRVVDVSHIQLWLGIAAGNYALSKVTEMICSKKEDKTNATEESQ